MAKKKRVIYRVLWNRESRRWIITKDKKRVLLAGKGTKKETIRWARKLARSQWANDFLAQVVVHKKDGKIAFEATYGEDPRRYPS